MSERTSLPVEFLFRIEAETSAPLSVSPGPHGDRLILGASGGRFEGPRLSGRVVPGPGSEWATLRGDGSLKADVRLVLETDDEAVILMTYNGVGRPDPERGLRITTAPLFETGDSRYQWLHGLQAIGIGAPIAGGVGYDVYAVEWPG
ncbi:MAG: DUF3237 domain-containing protein [Myxococcota bacterium]